MALAFSSRSKTFANTTFLLLLCFFFTSHIRSPSPSFNVAATLKAAPSRGDDGGCAGLQRLEDHRSKCTYLKSHARAPCVSQGYVDYLRVFYCDCRRHPRLGYALLALWLLVLFYLLGTTASQYFCSSVESLSRELRLPPTVAGVTLLSLGNGSPDVLASVVSFRSGSGEVGLSSVLGGAFFVSCVVVGIISVCAAPDDGPQSSARVDRSCFVRDVCFFLVVLSSLLAILLVGRINVWGAAAFASLYFVYVFIVSATHFCRGKSDQLVVPILEDRPDEPAAPTLQVASKDGRQADSAESTTSRPPTAADSAVRGSKPTTSSAALKLQLLGTATTCVGWLAHVIDMPLYLPRRLTIPDVSPERWCRPFAVASAALAPLLVAALWNSKRGFPAREDGGPALTAYACAGLAGLALGVAALRATEKSGPPKKALLPWLAGGFLMSVLWTYVIAEELVGLLVSLGYILGISPAILGLTVLAWGNSIGDLIANVAMAVSGGRDGALIAMSGCYAGPIFNTLAGLGLSMLVSAWTVHPAPFVIPVGPAAFEIVAFMIAGLLWALAILPRNAMKLDRVLGIGLLAIYLCFLSLRLSQSLGFIHVRHSV